MSNLSELLPAGGGGKNVNFVASGTLGNGVTVGLKADGTVELISGVTEGAGSPTVFQTGVTESCAAAYDAASNKIIVAYNNGSKGRAVVGAVSGSTISWGTSAIYNTSNYVQYVSISYNTAAEKVVISYTNGGNSSYGTAIVGTVSGTSISFGAATVFNSATTTNISSVCDVSSGKTVIAFRDYGNSHYGTAIVGTISGTSISFGSKSVFSTGTTNYSSTVFDSTNNKTVIAYQDNSNSNYGKAIVGTVSGTSISFGSAATFKAASVSQTNTTYDSINNKIVLVYKDGATNYGTALTGTISGTSISFGTDVVFASVNASDLKSAYDPSAGKIDIAYENGSNSGYGTVVSGAVSGTSISFGTAIVFESAGSVNISTAYDSSAKKVIIAYRDMGNSNVGTAVVFENASSNNTSFLGITDAAITSGASGSVTIKGGLKSELSSLTPNSIYYVQSDGSVTTVSTAPAVRIGKALSSTTLNLEFSS